MPPNKSLRAWSHNALRGQVVRARRSVSWLLSNVTTRDSTTPRAKKIAAEIHAKFLQLEEELRKRKDPK